MKEPIAKAPRGRVSRTPIGQRNRLSVRDQEPGFVYRIVNDVDDRVHLMQEQGYEIVSNTKVGDKRVDLPSSAGSASVISVGQGTKAVVMRQRKEFYDEDQAAKSSLVDATEQTMRQDARKASDYGSLSINER